LSSNHRRTATSGVVSDVCIFRVMEFTLQELDFRFADEDDASDIAVLVMKSSFPYLLDGN
jgi:hypothetical protein